MLMTVLIRMCVMIGLCGRKKDEEENPSGLDASLLSFSSKTAYRHSRLEELRESGVQQCDLLQVQTLLRHGTRFPGTRDIEGVQAVHKKIIKRFPAVGDGAEYLRKKDLQGETLHNKGHSRSILPKSFLKWVLPFSLKKKKALASVGYEEMILLGYRFRKMLSNIKDLKDYVKHVKVISSSSSRSKISGITFLKTLLENKYSEKAVTKMITENDHQLRFFDNCPYYTKTILNGKFAKLEFNRFMNGPEIRRVIKDIKQKWKLTDIDLTANDIRVLYSMCAFEIATNLSSNMRPHECPISPAGDGLVVCPLAHTFVSIETSPLCSLLEKDHYPILEYLYDINHYWTKSYAKEINWLQSCALMSPILEHIMKAARSHQAAIRASLISRKPLQHFLEQQNHIRAMFWFGHAETLLPFITLLGLFNQSSPMKASSFQQRLADINNPNKRFSTFQVSKISPFSGNVALNLYYCPHRAKGEYSGYTISVKSNEKSIAWSLVNDGSSRTSLETFTKHLNLCLPEKYDHNSVCIKGMSSSQLHEIRKRGDEL